ncbi:MAG: hypothetical protein QOC89_4926 [Paraburkholderia sp.]|jgi:hypothetical protein|nr:hypothetical protein [Paraburkholderia sp.]
MPGRRLTENKSNTQVNQPAYPSDMQNIKEMCDDD